MRAPRFATFVCLAGAAASCRCAGNRAEALKPIVLPDAALPPAVPLGTGAEHVAARFASPTSIVVELTYHRSLDAGDGSVSRVFEADLDSGETRSLYEGDEVRSWTVHDGRVVLLSHGKATTVDVVGGTTSTSAGVRGDVVSPDGRYAACTRAYCLEDLSTGGEVRLPPHRLACSYTTFVSWSPDSRLLYRIFEGRDIALCLDAEVVEPAAQGLAALRLTGTLIAAPGFVASWREAGLPDGGADYGLYSVRDFPQDLGSAITALASIPGSDEFVAGTARGRVVALRAGAHEIVREYQKESAFSVDSVAISGDGQRVGASTGSLGTRIWSVDGEPLATWSTGDDGLRDVQFDPSGDLLTGTLEGRIAVMSISRQRFVWIVPRRKAADAPPEVVDGLLKGFASGESDE